MKRAIVLLVWLLASVGVWADIEWETAIGQRDQVTKGLVSYWSMRNSGTTVYDEWGSNNGGASNGVTFNYESGAVGDGADMAVTNDFIALPSVVIASPANAHTLSAWYYFQGSGGNTILSESRVEDANNRANWNITGTIVCRDASNSKAVFFTNATLASGPYVITNEWTHIAFTCNGAGVYFCYVNGVQYTELSDTVTGGSWGTFNRHTLGALRYDGDVLAALFDGLLDEVRVYNVAKTHDEIKQLYRMGATPRGIR